MKKRFQMSKRFLHHKFPTNHFVAITDRKGRMEIHMKKYIAGFALFAYCIFAQAIEVFDQDIDKIGVQNGQTMYLYLKSNALSVSQCQWGVVYCPSTNVDCKSMLSVALTAKTTATKVYLAFDKDAQGYCNLNNIRF